MPDGRTSGADSVNNVEVVRWQQFAEEAPDLARLGRERMESQGVAMVGTLRRDGSPRISPVEPYFVGDELMLGMMWRSMKALDLLRDARLAVHSATTDRDGLEGDFKLYGIAVPRDDPGSRAGYSDATSARINWRPPDPFHLFAVDIHSAGYMVFGEHRLGLRWRPGGPPQRFEVPD
ncbi:MAG TPA: pyridoxamine 5'-phosphate oxidase family protein [Candidatus Dormibacteraeota bacterium]|nr:pyridoxamine 5'-phosphate oxidase family protein [Candidatus Dormibacteraeota bacterium]